ncbi:MAG: DUF58 domain-containing protein [Spirochaetes bacterium]|nr:DUF58 domain-containing protein [Spirochaetota bacterium]
MNTQMNDQKEHIVSSFFGFPLSILLLGALFFVALVNRSIGLISVAGTTLLLMVGSILWARFAPFKVFPHLHMARTRLFPGEDLHLELFIRNEKLLPFYFSLEAPFHIEGQSIIPPFSQFHRSWNISLRKRGVYPLESCSLAFGDPFGLSLTKQSLPLPEEIIVYPRMKPIEGPISQFQEFFGLHPAKGLVEDPAWYAGTRDYTGDRPARFIHWKASARIGTVQEKIFEPTSHAKILVLVKVEGFTRALSKISSADPSQGILSRADLENAFENLLETVASWAYLSFKQGASLAFVTDGELVGDPEPFLPMGSGYEHLGRLLEKLARLRFPHSNFSWDGFNRLAYEIGRWGTGYIYSCYHRSEGEQVRQYLAPYRKNRLLILSVREEGE